MDKRHNITSPRYQQIATDIASKIVDKHFKVGDKIYARSSIASQYGVSSETARRAICILSDMEIVETTKGSGVIIKSYEKAFDFVRQYNDIQTVNNLKQNILESVQRQKKELEYFNDSLTKLIERTDRFRSINPFVPFEIEITTQTPHLNKTISEVNFWHNTSATIIAIKRDNMMLMSPGPYALLSSQDIVYFVGDENCLARVQKFLFPMDHATELDK
jgi:K+/H+ antiporter YhaU regulatory subunit KhtT